MASYYVVTIRYDKTMENGSVKRVAEKSLVDALSCVEAVERVTEEKMPFISGDFLATSVQQSKIAEVFGDEHEKFYLAKLAFITLDERTAEEKRTISQILVSASDFDYALAEVRNGMQGTIADYEIISLSESPIIDYYPAKL